jgi:hypothetical protein
MSFPCLSIRQPWASSIVLGDKRHENRTWPTRFRGRFYIHAAKGWTGDERQDWLDFIEDRNLKPHLGGMAGLKFRDLPLGGIIGHADLVDCVTSSESPWFIGPYAFVLANVKPLPFTPCKGALGFFALPAGLEISQ